MADTTFRLAGTAYLNIDGTNYVVAGEAAYNVSKVTRETLTGMGGVDGYAERPHAGYISMQLRDSGGLTVADLNALTNVNCQLELANGKTIIGRNMWSVETQEAKATDATIEFRLEGPEVFEA